MACCQGLSPQGCPSGHGGARAGESQVLRGRAQSLVRTSLSWCNTVAAVSDVFVLWTLIEEILITFYSAPGLLGESRHKSAINWPLSESASKGTEHVSPAGVAATPPSPGPTPPPCLAPRHLPSPRLYLEENTVTAPAKRLLDPETRHARHSTATGTGEFN